MDAQIRSVFGQLERLKQLTDASVEYWSARQIQQILGYSRWEKFEPVIRRAMNACESAGTDSARHFHPTVNMVSIGSGAERERADCFVTRYGAYLISMNGDTKKPEVGAAQTYFAMQTRRMEQRAALEAQEQRLELRERVSESVKSVNSAAKKAGVQRYDVFHAEGYRGMYGGLGLVEIKERKGIPQKQELFDRAGRSELAANAFRFTQTEELLVRERIEGEGSAVDAHRHVGREVRGTIDRLGGTMPEDLPAEESIRPLIQKRRRARRKIQASTIK
jgi:DNA-damage-inducible protein D